MTAATTHRHSACLCRIQWPLWPALPADEDISSTISPPHDVICHCPSCCPDHYTWLPLPPTPPPPLANLAPLVVREPANLFTIVAHQSSLDSSSKCSCPVYDAVLSWQCVTFLSQCETFLSQCGTFLSQCETFLSQCGTFLSYVGHFCLLYFKKGQFFGHKISSLYFETTILSDWVMCFVC